MFFENAGKCRDSLKMSEDAVFLSDSQVFSCITLIESFLFLSYLQMLENVSILRKSCKDAEILEMHQLLKMSRFLVFTWSF